VYGSETVVFSLLKCTDTGNIASLHALCCTDSVLRAWLCEEWRSLLEQPSVIGHGFFSPHLVAFVVSQYAFETADILFVGTHPDVRRQGVGHNLLKEHITALQQKGVTTLHIDVATQNAAALSFYETLGFRKIGLRRAYYKQDDAWSMMLRLS
jgi:[ribosomal protein S18]-alanine N-acetyltransferase